jgi:hypothetical protein
MEITFRRKAAQAANELGDIDIDRFHSEGRTNVFVVPSPARRQEPAQWAHTPVPLQPKRPLSVETDAAMARGGN